MDLYIPHESWVQIDRYLWRSRWTSQPFELTAEVQVWQASHLDLWAGSIGRPWLLDRVRHTLDRQTARNIVCSPAMQVFDRYAEVISWLRCD